MAANDWGVKNKVFVHRTFELGTPGYGNHEVNVLSLLPPLLSL
jgi:2-haloacid dehalogenase